LTGLVSCFILCQRGRKRVTRFGDEVASSERMRRCLGAVGSAYQSKTGKLYNLNADACIMDHSDIAKSEVAYALLSAVATI
jgi:hypothetical protein